jgi:hypothetical protein
MKRVYSLVLAIGMMAGIPRICFAQCLCSGGVPANTIVNYTPLPATNVAVSTISFAKFNPAIGNLSCVSLVDTITAVSTTHVWNKASAAAKYKFDLQLNNDIEGPGGGISASSSFNKIYGPDSLQAAGLPGDSITYGPDSIYVNNVDSNGTSNTAPYLGTVGTVDFTYAINGGLNSIIGGLNYGDSIYTTYSGFFKLTYYWCPAVVLAESLEGFTATPNGSALLFQWIATNEQNNTNYEIQLSTDGKTFNSIGQTESNTFTTGSTAKYQYQYHPDPVDVGPLYFRIKVTAADGEVSYSTVLVVNLNSSGVGAPISYQTFPNPASHSLVFQFNSNQTGRYMLELINVAGQVVQQKAATLTGTSQIRLDLNPQPAKGLYYLRTRDISHNQEYVSKVLIN